MDHHSPSAIAEDQPIPANIVGNLGGWGSRANQYPVFSQTWFRYRARFYLIPIALAAAFLLAAALLFPQSLPLPLSFVYIASLNAWLSIVISLLLGRWMAVRIRLRGWSAKKEAQGIVLALVLGVGIAQIFNWYSQVANIPYGQAAIERAQKLRHPLDNDADVKVKAEKQADKKASKNIGLLNNLIWFTLFVSWGGSFDLAVYFKQRRAVQDAFTQQQIDRYKKDRNDAELRLSVLASQIEPHFLFNTLSGVRSAILSDPARGVAIIDHLVEYLRATIPQMRDDGVCTQATLRAQFDSIRAYLGVIHFRIPRLSYSVECDSALDDLTIPPLMLISLVENAVKHGVEQKKGPVHITVTAKEVLEHAAERLVLIVSDNGVGFGDASSGSGIGLTNIRERLKQLYGDQAALSLEANDEGGIDAKISLPI